MSAPARRRAGLWLAVLACTLGACRAVPPEARLALAPVAARASRVVVAIQPSRRLQGLASTWQASDVYSYEVTLAPQIAPAAEPPPEPEASLPVPPATRTVELVQRPGQVNEAVFDELPEGWCYEARVRALGGAGGQAPERCLNTRTPAVGLLDLRDPAASRRLELSVQLDPTVFAATVELPATAPVWTTRLEATLSPAGASADPVASASWLPGQQARLINVRGDHPYDLAIHYHSPTGHRTVSFPGFLIPRAHGQATRVRPEVTAPAPPTGTILGRLALASEGAFMGAFDPSGRCWVTHQKANRVSVRDGNLQAVLPPIQVGTEPRGIAVDPANGDVWVANFRSHTVTRLDSSGAVLATHSAGFFPGGIAVDPQHRVWVASAFFGTVKVMEADGTEVEGSPFYSGAQPTALTIDRTSGEVWVANMGDRTITKFAPNGEVAGVYGAGFEPGGIAIGPDHTAWVVDATNHRVWRFSADGAVIGEPITVGAGPAGIALDPRTGDVWVGIMNGEQVTRLGSDGTVLGVYPAGAFPGTLAVEPSGHVWVVGGGAVARLAP